MREVGCACVWGGCGVRAGGGLCCGGGCGRECNVDEGGWLRAAGHEQGAGCRLGWRWAVCMWAVGGWLRVEICAVLLCPVTAAP